MLPRPRIRLPIWAALAIVSAAFFLRSLVIRGGDFTVELSDVAVFALVLAAGLVVWLARRQQAADEGDGEPNEHGDDEYGGARDEW